MNLTRTSPRYLADGDTMSVWVAGIAELVNPCVVD
jgi:hypothetical protein